MLLVSACSNNSQSDNAKSGQENAKYKGQEITALLEQHPTSNALQKMLPEFEKETGIKVNLEIIPEGDIPPKALLDFSSKTGRYDIVMADWIFGQGFQNGDYIEPLNHYIDNPSLNKNYNGDDFLKSYREMMKKDGKYYGLPVYGESTFFMYRKDLFEKYGIQVPKTFDDLMNAAKTIHDKTNGDIAGITLRGQQGIEAVYIWAGILGGFGAKWLDDKGKSAIASPESIAATKFYSDLLRKYGPTGVANFGWQENRLLFQQGKAAMTIDATVNGAFNEDPKESSIVGKVGYAPVPVQSQSLKGKSSSLDSHGFYLSKESKHKEAAWLFMSWATNKEQQLKSLKLEPNCGITSITAINSPEFSQKFGTFKDVMLEAINNGNPDYLPLVPNINEVINNTGIAISKSLLGASTPELALKEANDKNNDLLK
ncbi:sugar ABC transporter substrate-binding protein [Gordoniibacillus kamchatkensis]|uniref:Sugar ABC transporter substrate-binding protein n=2 Tax=Gordoniibacillus kamchatkensis TaxID=1590651 RepID=A0ABR5AMV7_9BACL|nr:sugar ABC transporter substrate-binding protein [Paenibacillus sp. VKM B-2647]